MRALLKGIGILALATLVLAVTAEVALRAVGFSAPIFYRPDPQLGWTLRPGAKGWFQFEGRGYVRVNEAGFRDRRHELAKRPGTYRVALLGDSFAEAMQVDFKSTIGWQLEERLAACAPAGTRVEVMNFGVSGFGTAQEAILLETTAIKYRPDLVLLAFTNGNDLLNNSPQLEMEKERPFFRIDEKKELRLDASFASSETFAQRSSPWHEYYRAAADRLRVVQAVHRTRKIVSAIASGQAHAQAQPAIPGVEPGTSVAVFAPPRDAAWEEAWSVTERLVARMNAFAKKNGARFVLTNITFAAQVHPDATLRRNLQNALGVPDLFYIERRMEALARAEGFTAIPLAYDMQRHADARRVYLHGFKNVALGVGHWNEEGHRMAAELLAARLCKEVF